MWTEHQLSDESRVDKREKRMKKRPGGFSAGDWEEDDPMINGVRKRRRKGT